MLENVQLWIYGIAAVINTVLVFALLEKHNWRAVTVWMLMLAIGVWCWHVGTFARFLVDQSVGPLADPIRLVSMITMALGLMLMPSAALHAAFRLMRQGTIRVGTAPDYRLAACYLPLLLLIPIGRSLGTDPALPFLDLVIPFRLPYVIWLSIASAIASTVLVRIASASPDQNMRRFYRSVAASLIVIASLTVAFLIMLSVSPIVARALQHVVGVSPLLPVLLFAYFVMRFQLLPMILERTLVYGAVLVGVMLFHRLVLRNAVSPVEQAYRLDFGVVEGALALMVVLLYQPLRYRVAEALQTLVDYSDVRRTDRSQLAVQLASRAGQPIGTLLQWFTETIQKSYGTDLAAGWICDRNGSVVERAGSAELLSDIQVESIRAVIERTGDSFMTRYSTADVGVQEFLTRVNGGAVLRFHHAEISGLFLIGCRAWGQPPDNEELYALSLLVEQFGVTLQNSQLQAVQQATEHRILQQEKLSALGLLASSLAHEIKNPLSSIKTISRVLAEELGPDSPYAEDLRMISGEVDRLSVSTSELLDAARPPRKESPPRPLPELLASTLRMLHHLAHERQAELTIAFTDQSIIVAIDQIGLREIIFNLVSNGLEAAGAGGTVRVSICHTEDAITFEISDTGPGFTPEQQTRLFDPFYTTRQTGTGLGLYIVARRVRELGGHIECESVPYQATTFRVRLPLLTPVEPGDVSPRMEEGRL